MKIIGEELERVTHFKFLGTSTEEVLCGNGDHSANGTGLEKMEEMQGSIVRRRIRAKLIRPVLQWGRKRCYNEETRNWININEMIMLRWMYEMTRNIWNEHLRGTKRVAQASIRSLRECRTGKGM